MARESKFTQIEMFEKTKELLLQNGYSGFTFGLLAEELDVSRGAIYKYFANKDELITEYMVYEMENFLQELAEINTYPSFRQQLAYLLTVIFSFSKIHQILSLVFRIENVENENVRKNLDILQKNHSRMYGKLQAFIQLGRKENILKPSIPDHLILGFIFQTVDIPNHARMPEEEWRKSIEDLICHGMTENDN